MKIDFPLGLDSGPISESLQAAIDAALADLAPEESGSLLVVGTREGAKAVVASKLGEHWTVGGGVWMPFTGENRLTPTLRAYAQARW